jgi:hypothetical protein
MNSVLRVNISCSGQTVKDKNTIKLKFRKQYRPITELY